MFEGVVSQVLAGYLGRFVKGIQKDQLKIGIWNGPCVGPSLNPTMCPAWHPSAAMALRFAPRLLLQRLLTLRRARSTSSILVAFEAFVDIGGGGLFSPPGSWSALDPRCVSRVFFFAQPLALNERPNPAAIGRVGKLSIKIPWKKLGWDPIIVVLENIFICACQREDNEWSSDLVEKRELAGKMAKLNAIELAKLSRRVSDYIGGLSMC
ncbi:vacuolar protein [Musa troglodytarum]|uniref:Vacuolar protein n=1 Tax=Musa troglodytarum TaxID=320322 RepID=A0A9E7HIB4_9LILI|nr:vacuolar protein [Musa troglodytarum]